MVRLPCLVDVVLIVSDVNLLQLLECDFCFDTEMSVAELLFPLIQFFTLVLLFSFAVFEFCAHSCLLVWLYRILRSL